MRKNCAIFVIVTNFMKFYLTSCETTRNLAPLQELPNKDKR